MGQRVGHFQGNRAARVATQDATTPATPAAATATKMGSPLITDWSHVATRLINRLSYVVAGRVIKRVIRSQDGGMETKR